MKTHFALASIALAGAMFSCVSPKKLREAEGRYSQLNGAYLEMQGKLRDCEQKSKDSTDQFSRRKAEYESKIANLNEATGKFIEISVGEVKIN